MTIIQALGTLELGLLYALVALGVFVSFRSLQFPDLTVDGSFPLGAAISAFLIVCGVSPAWATLLAIIGGALIGFITAWLSTHLKVLNLLAGILSMTALYSINLRVMGRPNVSLLGENTLFNILKINSIFSIFIMVIILTLLLYIFLNTEIGLALRAVGNNPKMARAQGIDDRFMIGVGLAISNAFVALAGSLFSQFSGFSDVSMGLGTIITGLAAVIIGEALFSTKNLFYALISCVLGSIVYRFVISFALNMGDIGLQASDHNLVTAILVAGAMLLPNLKKRLAV